MLIKSIEISGKSKLICVFFKGGTGWRSWLRHCAASRKVAGSISDEGHEDF